MAPRRSKKIPEEEVKISVPVFMNIVEAAVKELGLSVSWHDDEEDQQEGAILDQDFVTIRASSEFGANTFLGQFNAARGYERVKHWDPKRALLQTKATISALLAKGQMQSSEPGALSSQHNLYPTVQSRENCERYMLSDPFNEEEAGVVFRPWSSEAKDPRVALVYGFETLPGAFTDAWVVDPMFLSCFASPQDALNHALQNLDSITPQHLAIQKERSLTAVRSLGGGGRHPYVATLFGKSPNAVIVTHFGDHRDCPRFLLARVVKAFAAELGCREESVVITLWTDAEVHVASAEDPKAMYTLGKMQYLRKMQINRSGYEERITSTPFQVKSLPGKQGAVEWKPYPLYGKMEALAVSGSTPSAKPRVYYPVPRTEADARKLERLGKDLPVVTSLTLPQCSQCGKEGEDLLRCAACKKMRYCSKECQKKHWASGHQTSCKKVQK